MPGDIRQNFLESGHRRDIWLRLLCFANHRDVIHHIRFLLYSIPCQTHILFKVVALELSTSEQEDAHRHVLVLVMEEMNVLDITHVRVREEVGHPHLVNPADPRLCRLELLIFRILIAQENLEDESYKLDFKLEKIDNMAAQFQYLLTNPQLLQITEDADHSFLNPVVPHL